MQWLVASANQRPVKVTTDQWEAVFSHNMCRGCHLSSCLCSLAGTDYWATMGTLLWCQQKLIQNSLRIHFTMGIYWDFVKCQSKLRGSCHTQCGNCHTLHILLSFWLWKVIRVKELQMCQMMFLHDSGQIGDHWVALTAHCTSGVTFGVGRHQLWPRPGTGRKLNQWMDPLFSGHLVIRSLSDGNIWSWI